MCEKSFLFSHDVHPPTPIPRTHTHTTPHHTTRARSRRPRAVRTAVARPAAARPAAAALNNKKDDDDKLETRANPGFNFALAAMIAGSVFMADAVSPEVWLTH